MRADIINFLSYLREMTFNFSLLSHINCRFFADAFFNVEKDSLYSLLVGNFYHEQLLDLVNLFFCIIVMVMYIFVFYSANMVYYSNWCSVIKPTLHSWHKFHLVTVCNSLYVLLGQFANILLSSFVSLYKMNIGMLFSFLEMYLSNFGTGVI